MTQSRQKSQAADSTISELTDSSSIHPESSLQDLPLHRFTVELSLTGAELAILFQFSPQVPGLLS
jgi:hypothetical protein